MPGHLQKCTVSFQEFRAPRGSTTLALNSSKESLSVSFPPSGSVKADVKRKSCMKRWKSMVKPTLAERSIIGTRTRIMELNLGRRVRRG